MILYHYCSVEKFLKILQNKCLWLTDLACTNDKLEIKYGNEALLRHFERITSSKPSEELISYIFNANRVGYAFCMSENGNLLSQWRGYADFGKGVSIGFETDLLGIQKQYPWYNNNEPNFGIEKVIYNEDKIDDAIIHSLAFKETIRDLQDYDNLTKRNIIDKYHKYYPDKDFSNDYSKVCKNICPIAFYIKNKSFDEECE